MKNLRNVLAGALVLGATVLAPQKTHADELSVQAGVIPDAALVSLKNQSIYNNVLFQKVEAEIDIVRYLGMSFFIGGSMTVFEVPQTNTLAPWVFYSGLEASAGLQLGNFRIVIKHGSQHPETPYGTTLFNLGDGFQDSIYLEYRAKLPPILDFSKK